MKKTKRRKHKVLLKYDEHDKETIIASPGFGKLYVPSLTSFVHTSKPAPLGTINNKREARRASRNARSMKTGRILAHLNDHGFTGQGGWSSTERCYYSSAHSVGTARILRKELKRRLYLTMKERKKEKRR